ncbi:effector-associated constant component EACC1 [Nocardia sp. NPDC004582]
MATTENDHNGETLLRVSMSAAGIDDEHMDRQTRMLRAELAAMDGVESAVLARDNAGAAPGSKVVDPVTIGAIVLALSASGGVFTTLIETVRDWLNRDPGTRQVTVTLDGESIELDAASDADQHALVEAFLRRHGAVAG